MPSPKQFEGDFAAFPQLSLGYTGELLQLDEPTAEQPEPAPTARVNTRESATAAGDAAMARAQEATARILDSGDFNNGQMAREKTSRNFGRAALTPEDETRIDGRNALRQVAKNAANLHVKGRPKRRIVGDGIQSGDAAKDLKIPRGRTQAEIDAAHAAYEQARRDFPTGEAA